ncbi:neuropeptide receptor 15-like [Ornithodoros turicata]|uniref:neuropeptide receptor 15-like n=1 Tax=Ornithodoros turicata TaxID=34597 RepID=UPI0031398715
MTSPVTMSPINSSTPSPVVEEAVPASAVVIACLSVLFFTIGSIGVIGNAFVIWAVIASKNMRSSVTNMFLLNLAVSDLIIMLACVPDIVQFILNHGWQLGLPLCRILRFTEVFALYASVMTLVGVCVERYVAIIHPMRAHLLCCRARMCVVICLIWPLAMACAAPNLLCHVLLSHHPDFTPCVMQFPSPNHFLAYKFAEFFIFYLLPLIIQVVLYTFVGRKLFSSELFHAMEPAVGREKYARAMRARRGVIKMLVAGVAVYFISFSPHQALLFYNTFSPTRFEQTWPFLIFVNMMAYFSSACNPLLYSIFSHRFREKFVAILLCRRTKQNARGSSRKESTVANTGILIGGKPQNKNLKTAVCDV